VNIQKPEPRVKGEGQVLDFHSMFYTIQGEGPFAGHPAIFIRLAGCNLQCPGCDTEYTFGREAWDINRICAAVQNIAAHNPSCRLVVITGGEPLRQVIGPLVRDLVRNLGFVVQIESNGVFPPDPMLERVIVNLGGVSLVVSPKTSKINDDARGLASAFKYVLDHRSVDETDGLPLLALGHPAKTGVARPRIGCPIYVNPFDAGDTEENKKNLAAVVASCMKHGYIAGVQMHKIMNLA